MSETPDYYAILGVPETATPDQIKVAFREHAKHAHPDAGGSQEAMERLNEAYQALSDPASRREYDRLRQVQAEGESADNPTEQAHYSRQEEAIRADLHHKMRLGQARANALYLIQRTAPAALLLGIAIKYFAGFTDDRGLKLFFALMSFAPIYGVLLGITFLIYPQVRLNIYDFTHHLLSRKYPDPQLTRAHYRVFWALGLAWLPLVFLWAILFIGL